VAVDPNSNAASVELPTCPACGAASPGARDKSGHLHYGRWLSHRDFEQILLSLGASGSDVQHLWPEEVESNV
jgi:hypothetical protein